jgi:hypothetical protein
MSHALEEAKVFKESASDGFIFIVVLEIGYELAQMLKDEC